MASISSPARSPSSPRRATREGVGILADSALALVRGEALERGQRRRPDTTVEEYLERCTLKTAKLFEAACLLGSRRAELGEFGLALGIAFQIIDDCLDCAGQTVETGKIAGTDLREGIPTLPLLLAARRTRSSAAALAGGSLDGALLRVAASGAIDEAQRGRARLRRAGARVPRRLEAREELEAIADAVVEQDRVWPSSTARRRSIRSAKRWRPASGSTSRTGSR